jgi:benzoylformate decarboxylase
MTTIRDATYDLWRAHGMTTIFGNPGSTELPMLAEFPDDFRYVLGLQEAVVVGMADGYAQASGTVGHANLHTAPGVGNAMGAIFNAQANHTPLLITAGQQVRPVITMQANLTNREATRMPDPLVKWSYEPPRAEDVPAAIARGIHTAAMAPKGPAFVSVPMDDWTAEAPPDSTAHTIARSVSPIGSRTRAARCWSPAPTSTPRAAGSPPLLSPRSSAFRCGRSPPPAVAGSGSPRAIPPSRAFCRRRSARSRRRSPDTT